MKGLSLRFLTALALLVLFKGHGIGFPAVVDTDMAPDDVRAIVMLLNSGIAEGQLMATSDGALSPQQGARNLQKIAAFFGKGNIPIAQGRAQREWDTFLVVHALRKKGILK